jgi:hypothetical protein
MNAKVREKGKKLSKENNLRCSGISELTGISAQIQVVPVEGSINKGTFLRIFWVPVRK